MDRIRPILGRASAPDDAARLFDDYVLRMVRVEAVTRQAQATHVPA